MAKPEDMSKTDRKVGKAASRAEKPATQKALGKKPLRKNHLAEHLSLRYRPGPLIDSDETLSAAIAALRLQDAEVIDRMLEIGGTPPLRKREAGLAGLAWIVISQQVSTASASAIHGRFLERFPQPDAISILACDDEVLRGCGLSAPKIRTLRAVCAAVQAGSLDFASLPHMEAHAAHAALIAIKGIGPWTADIFLLFSLGHPDAWPVGDLALQEAARMALNLRQRPDAKRLERIGKRWRPWRGAAARLLWAYYGGMQQRRKALDGA